MRRTWPIPLAVAVVGALAGVAIAGRSDPIDTYVVDADTETSATLTPDATLAPPEATADVPTFEPPVDTNDLPTTPPVTNPPSTTSTTTTSTTTPATTTSTSSTTTTSSTPADQTLERADVRLVIANGDGRFNLAGRNGSRLAAVGYTQIDLEDAAKVPATVLYYRPGFDDEAAIVAADLTIPSALLQPLPDTPITSNDSLGDIVVVLGPDAPR